ncbi:hypothetical protein SNE40_016470 [Patella caerulea]|uniref:Uncharacterized protein n=1 Tax=Patella caerulea TaxID=87958 RepID=A0AAN8PJ65_PATCE
MSSDKTRWRSHVGLPPNVINDVARKAKEKKFEKIPRANDSNVRPKVIYVSRNASVRDDSYRSELFIPKRTYSHESIIPSGRIEVPFKEKISLVNGGLKLNEKNGFSPISSVNAINEVSPPTSPPPPPPPETPPPPLVKVPTPCTFLDEQPLSTTPPPPPLPTSSPPPLDDDDLPPPPSPITNSLPTLPPSQSPSFHGYHINLAMPNKSGPEDEIMRYLDHSIAQENIIISETTQAVDEKRKIKGDNSSMHFDGEPYLISKWDGQKVKTVRAFIKPGTVDELRELFVQLGLKYSKGSKIEKKKARSMLRKKREALIESGGDSQKVDIIFHTGIKKSESSLSDISTITNSSMESDTSAISQVEVSKKDTHNSLENGIDTRKIVTPPPQAEESKKETHNPRENGTDSRENVTTIPNVNAPEQDVMQLESNSNDMTTKDSYNFPAYESSTVYTTQSMDNDKPYDLSQVNDGDINTPNTENNEGLKESGLSPAENTYLGQRLLGGGVINGNTNKEDIIGGGSYSSVWASNFDINTSEKSSTDTNGWFNEDDKPVLPISKTNVNDNQRHSLKSVSVKEDLIDANMDLGNDEPDEQDKKTRKASFDLTHVTVANITLASSASTGVESTTQGEDHDSVDGTGVTQTVELGEDRPTSPKEQYDNLISELKNKASLRNNHVTDTNISEISSDTSSAKFSFNEDKRGDNISVTTNNNNVDESDPSSVPKQNYGNLLNEFKSVFMKKNFTESKESVEPKKSDEMPVLSGSDDLITQFNVNSLDLSSDFGSSPQPISSNLSDIMAASTGSRRSSSRSMRSSSSSASGSGIGGKSSGDIIMVEGSNGSVYMVEDISGTKEQETQSTRSSRSSSRMSQSGSYQIGSSGNVRIDSNVDNDTANEVISALYGLSEGNSPPIVMASNNNQKALSLRSSHSSSGSGVISLPGTVSRQESEDNNVTQDVKEHETVTIHGVTSDNVALIEHRVQKTVTRRKDVEESIQSTESSVDNELTIDTGASDYSVSGFSQRSSGSYNQPVLVTTQEYPAVNLGNSTMKTYTTAVLVPNNDTAVSTYNAGNLVAPATSTLNFSNTAFQPYQPVPLVPEVTSNANMTTITNNYVGTTTEYTLGERRALQTTNYVQAVEPTETSYKDVQAVLNNVDQNAGQHVTRIENTSDSTKKHSEDKDNETNYYSKKTITTTILPSVDVDSVYGSKSSRTTSEESPRDDDGPLYRVVRASMSPRRSQSPKRRTIYHEVDRRPRSPSPRRQLIYGDGGERRSRAKDKYRSDVYRSDRYVDTAGDELWRVRDFSTSEPRLVRSSYKDVHLNNSLDYDELDSGRKIKVMKTYASSDRDDLRRRKSSGYPSSDSDISDRNVTRVEINNQYLPRHRFTENRYIHGYESDDEVRRLYRISGHGKNGQYSRSRPESVMSDDQIYRVNRTSASPRRHRQNVLTSDGIYSRSRSTSPENRNRYKVVYTKPSGRLGTYKDEEESHLQTSRLDSGYFEPEYTTRRTRVIPSVRSTTLSPTRNSTVINLHSNTNSNTTSRVTSPTRGESLYRVVNVQSATDDKMSKSRRRRSRSSSESSSDGETRKYKISSTKHGLTTSSPSSQVLKENGYDNHASKLYIQRSFSPTPNVDDTSFRTTKFKSRSQDPIYRTRSPSPQSRHKTIVDVRRDYSDNLSKSISDLSQGGRNYIVHNTRSSDQPRSSKSERFTTTERHYRMRSPSPSKDHLSYRSFSDNLPTPMRSSSEYLTSNGGRSDFLETNNYESSQKVYKVSTQPQIVEAGEQSDLKVVRGQILIKNKIDTSKDEDDFDDNVNIFDNYFHLQKDNPLYQSDPDIYKSFEEETLTRSKNIGDAVNQDITFETVENIAKTHQRQSHVSTIPQKKQNLSQLLLSKLEKIDSKDIRQNIDVKHTNEEIFGDIEFINADGTPSSSNDTKNFDSVSENVDLTLRDGKAIVIITVNAERIVPIDYEFNVWRKSAAIVTRQIEIDLFANDQRRRLYQHVMETSGPVGAIEDGFSYRRNSRTGENEKVLNSMQTLKLFTEILDVAEGEGEYDEMSVETKQLQGQGQLPASEEIDFMY